MAPLVLFEHHEVSALTCSVSTVSAGGGGEAFPWKLQTVLSQGENMLVAFRFWISAVELAMFF